MSKDNFNKFCFEYIPKHPELGLGTDKLSPDGFAKIALVEGPKAGFSFTKAEVDEVLGAAQKKGQLSDKQLEGVSGGAALGTGVSADHAVSASGTAMCYAALRA